MIIFLRSELPRETEGPRFDSRLRIHGNALTERFVVGQNNFPVLLGF